MTLKKRPTHLSKYQDSSLSTGTSVQPQGCKALSLVDKAGYQKRALDYKKQRITFNQKLR